MSTQKSDWSASQYLKFANERTRPVYDLLAQVAPHVTAKQPRVYDLGCGPGNSTTALQSVFPGAKITGIDTSPDMLSKARAALPDVEFLQGDVSTFQVPSEEQATVDLIFSNAVFHWLRAETRLPTLARLLASLKPGAVLALQVPSNYHEPSHALMRAVASVPNKSWSRYFPPNTIGNVAVHDRPDLDPVPPPSAFYTSLAPLSSTLTIWTTRYEHVLPSAGQIVEWVKSTGLQPFLNKIEDDTAKKEFLAEYKKYLDGDKGYEKLGHEGKVMLGYPRLFVVAARK